jgi:hypothetical protein
LSSVRDCSSIIFAQLPPISGFRFLYPQLEGAQCRVNGDLLNMECAVTLFYTVTLCVCLHTGYVAYNMCIAFFLKIVFHAQYLNVLRALCLEEASLFPLYTVIISSAC